MKIILLLSCLCSTAILIWSQSIENKVHSQPQQPDGDKVQILLWSGENMTPFGSLSQPWARKDTFIGRNCSVTNCHVTTNKRLFGDDITRFDVIAFMGRVLKHDFLPSHRSQHQKYIYFNMESSPYFPVRRKNFDGFFNWTSTYRLDSDIPIPYILIKDKDGNVIGPKKGMNWSAVVNDEDDVTDFELNRKTKTAAIFFSRCTSLSKRERLIEDLNKELNVYNLTVDIYGRCGPFSCPKTKFKYCDRMLKTDYYFYLSFENSLDEDYVTEKLLRALLNDVVPVVYGGADYSRFLPPGSYLDASKFSPSALAKKMKELMNSPDEYRQYFKWKRHYTYHDPIFMDNICSICAKLNEPNQTPKVYNYFRKWWNAPSNNIGR